MIEIPFTSKTWVQRRKENNNKTNNGNGNDRHINMVNTSFTIKSNVNLP